MFNSETLEWEHREWMVVTGGYTDTDFCSFPVFAIELTKIDNNENVLMDVDGWTNIDRGWRDEEIAIVDKDNNYCGNSFLDEKGDYMTPMRPPARIGHISGISEDGVLFVMGGESSNGQVKDDTIFKHPDPGDLLKVWSAPILDLLLGNITVTENESDVMLKWTYHSAFNQTNDNGIPYNRGSMSGGVWKEDDSIVFHGGFHLQSETVLGDVWTYTMKNNSFNLLGNNPISGEIGYPNNRAAHAASVFDGVLYLHGGMSMISINEGDMYSSSRSITSWTTLSDVWEFNLLTSEWKERPVSVSLARAYHSMIVTKEKNIICFAGNRRGRDPLNNIVAYVFNDILVLEHNSSTWFKLEKPSNRYSSSPKFRFDHTAIVDTFGNMFVWGGKFQRVDQLFGLWKVFIPSLDEVRDQLIEAPSDETDVFTANMKSLQLFILTIMFVGMLFIAIYTTYRYQAFRRDHGRNGNGDAIFSGSRFGASQEVFDSIPTRSYRVAKQDGLSTDTEGIVENESMEDCCAICLDGYIEGDSLKCLPCGHDFHSLCVEEWIRNHNSTCPHCRQELTTTSVVNNNQSNTSSTSRGIRSFLSRYLVLIPAQSRSGGSVSTFNLLTARHSDLDDSPLPSPSRPLQEQNDNVNVIELVNVPIGNAR